MLLLNSAYGGLTLSFFILFHILICLKKKDVSGQYLLTRYDKCELYRVIQKDGLNFVSLYFKIRTSDKYDVNYI